MLIEPVKEGFNLTNKNFQLLFLRIALAAINFLSLLIFLGVPIIASVLYMGFDLASAVDLLPRLAENPFDLFSRYLGPVFLIGISFILYLIFASMIVLYSLGGTLGVLKDSAVNIKYRFSFQSFFKEANKIFPRLFWLTSALTLIFTVMFVVVIISGGIIAGFIQSFSKTETLLGIFFSSFALISLAIFGIIIFLCWLMFTVYSVISSVIDGKGTGDSIKNTFNFLKKNPGAFLFFIVLCVGAVVINVVFFIIMVPINMLPFVNILLSLVSFVLQNYLTLVIWSSLIVYYIKATNHSVYSSMYDI